MFRKTFVMLALAAFIAGCGPAPNNQQQPTSSPAAAPAPAPAVPAPEPKPKPKPRIRRETEQSRQSPRPAPVCDNCGTVTSVQPIKVEGKPSIWGTLAGAAAGGLLGSQFGKGTGKAAMTGAGVLGGAFAGRAAESELRSSTAYKVTVAMDNGSTREITLPATGGINPGTKVRVNGNTISPQ